MPKNATEFEAFLRSLVNLSFDNLSLRFSHTEDASTTINPDDYISIIHEITNQHDFYLSIDLPSKLSFKLDSVLTELGACSTFNSRALNAISWRYLLTGAQTPDQPVYKTFYAQGEAAATMINLNESGSVEIFFHSPLGVPTSPSHRVKVSEDSSLLTSLSLLTFDVVTQVKVKQLYHVQRKCLFFYEGQLKHSPFVYSHELCLRECRIDMMKTLCGCLPYFYRLADTGERYCQPGEISCIANHFCKSSRNLSTI